MIALFAARELADGGGLGYTLQSLREEWRASGFDLAADAVVVEAADGEIVAYADVRRPGTTAVVAPEHERRGIGARLLAWTQRRERELGRAHRQLVSASNVRARELLGSAGYAQVRSHFRMTRELDGAIGTAEPPTGVALRSPDRERDDEALHALDALSFAENVDYEAETLTEFRQEHLFAGDVDAELSYVAQSRDGAVGFLLTRRFPEAVGYIDLLAVHPEHRRRGLGSALLRQAFADYARAGLRHAQLMVASDNPVGLALYERVGMRVLARFDAYERSAADG